MTYIIDRRQNPKGKNHGNRQRFIRRAIDQIKQSVRESIKNKNIKELTTGENIKVPVRNLKEPVFGHDPQLGKKKYVLPNNKEFSEGDQIERPEGGAGKKGHQGANSGDGIDEFSFSLTREEFIDIFFEDMELPNLVKLKLKDINAFKLKRAGYTNTGNPANIDIKETSKLALARRVALRRPSKDRLNELERLLQQIQDGELIATDAIIEDLKLELKELKRRLKVVPWIDPVDIRYRNFIPKPQPRAQAVMFALMDVSGSMGEREKDIAKRFFLLLHMFLHTRYEKVDIIFIRHTHEAEEVDENTFFYDTGTGGTVVSEALKLMNTIIRDRYPIDLWNIYCAQASDGDNYGSDNATCVDILQQQILPVCQYMAYIQIGHPHIDGMFNFLGGERPLWTSYETVEPQWPNFQMKKIAAVNEIYAVFRQLFAKENHR